MAYNSYIPLVFVAAYLFLWIYGGFIAPLSPKDLAAIFFAPAFLLFLVTVLRMGISRPRPYESAGITPLKEKASKGNSCPSRHLACAGVVAACFLPYLPVVGVGLLILALGLGYARFSVGWHFLSDLIVGFLMGVAVGCIPFFV